MVPDKLLSRLRESAGLRNIGKMTLASALGQIMIMGTMPIMTRLYSPEEFGIFSLLASFTGIATVAACLCLDLAVVQGRDDAEADELFAAALRSVGLTAIVSAGVMAILVSRNLFGFGILSIRGVPIVAAIVALNGVYLASRYRQLRDHRFGLIASAIVFQNFGRAVAPMGWYFVTHGWTGLALGEITGRLLGTRRLLLPLVRSAFRSPAFRSTRHWWSVVKREWRYTGVLLGSVLIDSSSSFVLAPIIAAVYGASAAGEYYLITTFLNAPLALIGAGFADVIHARSASLTLHDPKALPGFVRRAAGVLFVAGVAVYVPVFFLGPLVLPLVFGRQWALIVPIARSLIPFMIAAMVASPCSRVLVAVRETGIKMAADVLRLVVAPLTLFVAAHSKLSFGEAIHWLGIVLALAYGIYFATEYALAIRVARRSGRSVSAPLSLPEELRSQTVPADDL
jgi:O-antigen/teichoic acid export membrane protein